MSIILNIETATEICSVALSEDNTVLFERINTEGRSHANQLGVFVDEAMQYVRANSLKLDAVAVSCGPGSYTGLRIGVSEAKGLCYGLQIPLIAIETLDIMAQHIIDEGILDTDTLLCPMIDARRMEVYASIYDSSLKVIRDTAADIVDDTTYKQYLEKSKVAFFGNGADKCKGTITDLKAIFIDNVYPKAKDMVKLSNKAFAQKSFVDVAYFEPFYLKDFVTTTPKNKIL